MHSPGDPFADHLAALDEAAATIATLADTIRSEHDDPRADADLRLVESTTIATPAGPVTVDIAVWHRADGRPVAYAVKLYPTPQGEVYLDALHLDTLAEAMVDHGLPPGRVIDLLLEVASVVWRQRYRLPARPGR